MNRCKHEILADVLRKCSDGKNKTQLMYHCTLSFTQIKRYLPFLVAKGFIVAKREKVQDLRGATRSIVVHRATERGVVLLMALENVEMLLEHGRKVATATTT